MGVGLYSWLFQEEQISVKDESWASSRGHNFHASCMPVQGTNTSEFGCGTTVLGQSSGSLGHPRSKDVMRRPDNDIHSRLGRRRVSRSRATRKSSRCVGHFIVEIDRGASERSGVL